MSSNPEITVVVSTYNRGEMLRATLESLVGQDSRGVSYEVIVVDNNSKDETSRVIKEFIASSPVEMKYVFEPRQGVSYGRNAGIERARGAIIAFTDDDVRPLADWIAQIKRAFDLFPQVECVGGKILPIWNNNPPAWLTRNHWTAMALQDYGDVPILVNAEAPRSFAGANFSFRTEVFSRIGLFSGDLTRGQDTEMLLRFWSAGGQGLYAPDVVVMADVQPERLTKRYHREWHSRNGRINSMMRLAEHTGPDGRILLVLPETTTLFGAPAFIYRKLLEESGHWIAKGLFGQEGEAFYHEARIRFLLGYISNCYEQSSSNRKHSPLVEVIRFIKALVKKKLSAFSGN
jgi:glycosyltransferase involved in cell wall biosynthesis